MCVVLLNFPRVTLPVFVEWRDRGISGEVKSAFIRLAEQVSESKLWHEQNDRDLAVVKENDLLEQRFYHTQIGSSYFLPNAVRYSSPLVVKKLLEAGAYVDSRGTEGCTPLQQVICTSYRDDPENRPSKYAELLLNAGANPNECYKGLTLLDIVFRSFEHGSYLGPENILLAAQLLGKGAVLNFYKPRLVPDDKSNPHHNSPILRLLASTEFHCRMGQGPKSYNVLLAVHYSRSNLASMGEKEMSFCTSTTHDLGTVGGSSIPLQCLLDLGYPLEYPGEKSALELAEEVKSTEVISLLLKARSGASDSACCQDEKDDAPPLHAAAEQEDEEAVEDDSEWIIVSSSMLSE